MLISSALIFAGVPGLLSNEADALYDVNFKLTRNPEAAVGNVVNIYLNWVEQGVFTRIGIASDRIVIDDVKKGISKRYVDVKYTFNTSTSYAITASRRKEKIIISINNVKVLAEIVKNPGGSEVGIVADDGINLVNPSLQAIEPVIFSDNFMRTADETTTWKTVSGKWGLQTAWDEDPHKSAVKDLSAGYAQNPFAWVGKRDADVPALCVNGELNWDDYVYTAAVRGRDGGIVGLAANLNINNDGYLVRWSSASGTVEKANKLELCQIIDGKTTVISTINGGFIPDQWYKISIVSTIDEIKFLIDGNEKISLKNPVYWHGKIGLYADGAKSALYDDISVYGKNVKTDIMAEHASARIAEKVSEDGAMSVWTDSNREWTLSYPSGAYCGIYHYDVSGDQWVSLKLTPSAQDSGTLTIALGSNGIQIETGVYAQINRKPAATVNDKPKTNLRICMDDKVFAEKEIPQLNPNEEYDLRFAKEGKKYIFEIDGDTVLDTDKAPEPNGNRPAFIGIKAYRSVKNTLALGKQILDYTFSDSPTDWTTEGTWLSTVRWACSPQWSFLGGSSRGDAVLWHKNKFFGNQDFEAFVGITMEYPGETEVYYDRYKNVGITICGDGVNPRNGYAAIYGADDINGNPNQRIVLLRNGVEIASIPNIMPGYEDAHRRWFHVELHKIGNKIDFLLDGNTMLSYTDNEPIEGGIPAVWTFNSGISVARVRLFYNGKTETAPEQKIFIEHPAIPEWVNICDKLTLDLSTSWSVTNKPLKFISEIKQHPDGDTSTVTFIGTKAVINPTKPGYYWYQIYIVDGENKSRAFNISFLACDSNLVRVKDNIRLLYRFDQGTGRDLKDVSGVDPIADMRIIEPSKTAWLPKRGIHISDGGIISTSKTNDKLSSIITKKQCTLEFWLSTDTLNPPRETSDNWKGAIFSWQAPGDKVNFSFGHKQSYLGMLVHSTNVDYRAYQFYGDSAFDTMRTFRTGLTHIVVTWDGTNTYYYRNGQKVAALSGNWGTAEWASSGIISIGNDLSWQRSYYGKYYLAAVYDKAFTQEQITRNFNAGPDAN